MIKTRSDNEADKSATQSASYCPLIDQVKYFCYTVFLWCKCKNTFTFPGGPLLSDKDYIYSGCFKVQESWCFSA